MRPNPFRRVAYWTCLTSLCGIIFSGEGTPSRAAPPAPADAARVIDGMLSDGVWRDAPRPDRADDHVLLRRMYFDLVGHPPDVAHIETYMSDASTDKYARQVERLLQDPRFAENWAYYWRDVILFRRSEPRGLLAAGPLTDFFRQALSEHRGWDAIARELITAEGDVREQGATGLIMAHNAQPEETVAELSRIFLGIQIQCAQCHDHPYDRWKREEFHELAAFFPRVAARPKVTDDQRSFIVFAVDRPPLRRAVNTNNRLRGTLEHRMPNLADPQAPGDVMMPRFFLTGEALPLGTPDAERRGALAEWITSPDNPWFARAFVNRLWTQLLGEGFYPAVDDLGPDRDAVAPQILDYLCHSFVASGHDVRWLLATLVQTAAYQQPSASRAADEQPPFLANHPTRLRSDQLYRALQLALSIPDSTPGRGGPGPNRRGAGPRAALAATFGFDPSDPPAEMASAIPQSLLLMNSPVVSRWVTARGTGGLSNLLRTTPDDAEVIEQLYLRCLSRPPTPREMRMARQAVSRGPNRMAGAEDLLWALVNSAEFLYRS